MHEHGIVYPATTILEANRAHLKLSIACALLDQETGGGTNEFGHDPTSSIPVSWRGRFVTRSRYAYYRVRRRLGKGMQGVGPCQLTYWSIQDRADALGGCWKPWINMHVGFGDLAGMIREYGMHDGLRRYNGSGAAAEHYAGQVTERIGPWHERLVNA
jgi:hypothetical protein